MVPSLISLIIVLTIVGFVAWGVAIVPELPAEAARLAYALCGVAAVLLICNFVLGLTGHPWFEYGGHTPP